MILIMEDDADREAFQQGSAAISTNLFAPQDVEAGKHHTVWSSPQAYAEDVVLADVRKQVMALAPDGSGRISKDLVLACLMGELQ